jgi:hypothetical protein
MALNENERMTRLMDSADKLRHLATAFLDRHKRTKLRANSRIHHLATASIETSTKNKHDIYSRAQDHHKKVNDLHTRLADMIKRKS